LKSAKTEEAVLAVARDYLASWTPEEIAQLPDGAWPHAPRSGAQLINAALAIGQLHSQFRANRAGLSLLQELLLFFTQGAVRFTQVARLPSEPPALTRPAGGRQMTDDERDLFEPSPIAGERLPSDRVEDPD
jgi:hypothetical protein